MRNTFGNMISVTLFGESHGEAIGACIDGLAPGIKIDEEYIKNKLTLRRPEGEYSTARAEKDCYSIISGVYNGFTTGSPLCFTIPNENTKSSDYSTLKDTPRPSHADYVAGVKYSGFADMRGSGHFSGRITAALVLAGAIVASALENKGIYIGSHIKSLHGKLDRDFLDYEQDICFLGKKTFPVLSSEAEEEMKKEISLAKENLDSVGGVIETAIIGLPVGVGEPWFDSLEGVISHAVFSVPAVKGIEFGLGFDFADKLGSEANDPFCIEKGQIKTRTNNNGGINGGISNGMPVIFRSAIKPTPSIYKEQDTVSLSEMKQTKISIKGRHDPAIIHRARAVIDAVSAIAVADMLSVKYGTDWLR